MQAKRVKGLFLFDQEEKVCAVALDGVDVRRPFLRIDEEQKRLMVFNKEREVAECEIPENMQGKINRAFVTLLDDIGNAVEELEAEVV